MQIFRNDGATANARPRPSAAPLALHQMIDGYEPTPLITVPDIAARVGVREVLIKHEAQRFGLPAFKIIGASWATYRALSKRLGHTPEFTDFDGLRAAFAPLAHLTLTTATDGNHGRAVARAARWFGLGADIYMPAGTAAARVAAIESEGATVTVIDGDYDLAVEIAAGTASGASARPDSDDRIVVSDTSWPGYTEIPAWITEGYETIFAEIDDQLAAQHFAPIDGFIVPVGVGALALAALDHWPLGRPGGPSRIAVEPTAADCLYRSMEAGEPVTVPGPHDSIMAGMNCGTLSMIAWPTMRDCVDACITIENEHAAEAMRLLADAGIVAGETGAASLGALVAAAEAGPSALEALGLDATSSVLCICTEGATDPVNYRQIVGRDPASVTLP